MHCWGMALVVQISKGESICSGGEDIKERTVILTDVHVSTANRNVHGRSSHLDIGPAGPNALFKLSTTAVLNEVFPEK